MENIIIIIIITIIIITIMIITIIITIIIITIIIINVIHRLPGTSFSLHPHECDASRLGIIPFQIY